METSAAITASMPGRYAAALHDLAKDRHCVASVEADLDTLAAAIGETPDLAALIRAPGIARTAMARTIAAVGETIGLGPLTQNFLGVLAGNNRLAALPEIIRAFAAIAAADRGEIAAEVVTAHPLDDGQMAALAERLRAHEGKDVRITATVDPDLLGGIVVRIGSRQIDSSIRTRLTALARAIRG